MNILALLLIVAAVVLFLVEALGPTRRWVLPLGLACFAGAFLAQNVVQGMHQFIVH